MIAPYKIPQYDSRSKSSSAISTLSLSLSFPFFQQHFKFIELNTLWTENRTQLHFEKIVTFLSICNSKSEELAMFLFVHENLGFSSVEIKKYNLMVEKINGKVHEEDVISISEFQTKTPASKRMAKKVRQMRNPRENCSCDMLDENQNGHCTF
jgi:hypothetical protein